MANDDDDVDNTKTDDVNSALIENLQHSKFFGACQQTFESFFGTRW